MLSDAAEKLNRNDLPGPSTTPGDPARRSRAAALARLDRACDRFASLDGQPGLSPLRMLHATAAGLHTFAAAVDRCEEAGLTGEDLRPRLEPLRRIHARSPFVRRLQTWPRGYPGDFETVEYLCEAKNRAEVGTVGWAIEEYALQSPVAQQHRNKVGLQARAVLATLLAHPDARVASIGCGGCRDLSLIQDYIADAAGTFVLIDADADALAFAKQRLDRLARRCELVQGRVPRVLSALGTARPFDLVVAGGLFDYLPDRWAVATLRGIRRMMVPGGRLLFSNIAAGNPFRVWLEYLADWRLLERDETDLRRLLDAAGFPDGEVRVYRDVSGLALLADVRRAGAASA